MARAASCESIYAGMFLLANNSYQRACVLQRDASKMIMLTVDNNNRPPFEDHIV